MTSLHQKPPPRPQFYWPNPRAAQDAAVERPFDVRDGVPDVVLHRRQDVDDRDAHRCAPGRRRLILAHSNSYQAAVDRLDPSRTVHEELRHAAALNDVFSVENDSHFCTCRSSRRPTGCISRVSLCQKDATYDAPPLGIAAPHSLNVAGFAGYFAGGGWHAHALDATAAFWLSPQSTADKNSSCDGINARKPVAAATDPRSCPPPCVERVGRRVGRNSSTRLVRNRLTRSFDIAGSHA